MQVSVRRDIAAFLVREWEYRNYASETPVHLLPYLAPLVEQLQGQLTHAEVYEDLPLEPVPAGHTYPDG